MIIYGLLTLLVGALGLRKLGTPAEQALLYHLNWADSLFTWMIMAGGAWALAGLVVWLWIATS